ncbi:MAG: S41 family peptidase [Acidobacteria bacterium]|nr:S41 family peptidase [Acidobacteriota bacterium]
MLYFKCKSNLDHEVFVKHKLSIFFLLTILLAAVFGGFVGDQVSAGGPSGDISEQLKNFTRVLQLASDNYAHPVSSEELIESAIRGMLHTLDPHSSYFDTRDYNRLQEEQQGKYYGLGITIRAVSPGSGRVVVVEPPAPGTPAYKAGLRAGDVITRIRREPIDDWETEEVISNLKGPKGSKVDITVERPGMVNLVEITVERDEIPMFAIQDAFLIRSHIGYIKINRFSDTTSDELEAALKKMDPSTSEGLILDLRGNPGGALNQAIRVTDQFLRKGQVIVSTRNRHGKESEYKAPNGSPYRYPMVVLIDRYSASASEIVSGALQDHDRALIVGETSFGKALVQTIYSLGDRKGLALTTGRYYTPSDRLIQRDYSGGFYEYYYNRKSEEAQSNGEVRLTDSGRKVYGGGGIAPDVKLTVETTKFQTMLNSLDVFFSYARKLIGGEVAVAENFKLPTGLSEFSETERKELMSSLVISDEILADFKNYLNSKSVIFAGEDFEKNIEFVKRRLKKEVFDSFFGAREGYKVAIEGDEQVQKAIELLPQAKALLERSEKPDKNVVATSARSN